MEEDISQLLFDFLTPVQGVESNIDLLNIDSTKDSIDFSQYFNQFLDNAPEFALGSSLVLNSENIIPNSSGKYIAIDGNELPQLEAFKAPNVIDKSLASTFVTESPPVEESDINKLLIDNKLSLDQPVKLIPVEAKGSRYKDTLLAHVAEVGEAVDSLTKDSSVQRDVLVDEFNPQKLNINNSSENSIVKSIDRNINLDRIVDDFIIDEEKYLNLMTKDIRSKDITSEFVKSQGLDIQDLSVSTNSESKFTDSSFLSIKDTFINNKLVISEAKVGTLTDLNLLADENFSKNLSEQIKFLVTSRQSEASIQLEPAELGRIDISIKIGQGNEAVVNITAQNDVSQNLLDQQSEKLRQILNDEKLNFSFSGQGKDNNSQSNQNQHHINIPQDELSNKGSGRNYVPNAVFKSESSFSVFA